MNVFDAFIGWILGKKTTPQHSQPASRTFGSSVNSHADNAARSQLVQVMMRDLLRKSGIPAGWVQCQIQVVASRSRGPGIYVQLIVKHWDERIMKYAFAFQKALLTDIVRFEPKAAGWLHGISWRLEVASTCPFATLPDKDFWFEEPQTLGSAAPGFKAAPTIGPTAASKAGSAIAPTAMPAAVPLAVPAVAAAHATAMAAAPVAVVEKPSVENDAKDDLERLFAIRDQELSQPAYKDGLPAGYERTEPAPLN